jgi:hypothetical protein
MAASCGRKATEDKKAILEDLKAKKMALEVATPPGDVDTFWLQEVTKIWENCRDIVQDAATYLCQTLLKVVV